MAHFKVALVCFLLGQVVFGSSQPPVEVLQKAAGFVDKIAHQNFCALVLADDSVLPPPPSPFFGFLDRLAREELQKIHDALASQKSSKHPYAFFPPLLDLTDNWTVTSATEYFQQLEQMDPPQALDSIADLYQTFLIGRESALPLVLGREQATLEALIRLAFTRGTMGGALVNELVERISVNRTSDTNLTPQRMTVLLRLLWVLETTTERTSKALTHVLPWIVGHLSDSDLRPFGVRYMAVLLIYAMAAAEDLRSVSQYYSQIYQSWGQESYQSASDRSERIPVGFSFVTDQYQIHFSKLKEVFYTDHKSAELPDPNRMDQATWVEFYHELFSHLDDRTSPILVKAQSILYSPIPPMGFTFFYDRALDQYPEQTHWGF